MNKFYMCVYVYFSMLDGIVGGTSSHSREILPYSMSSLHHCVILYPPFMMVRQRYIWSPLMAMRNMCKENLTWVCKFAIHSMFVLSYRPSKMLFSNNESEPLFFFSFFWLGSHEVKNVMFFSIYMGLPSCLFLTTNLATRYCLLNKKGSTYGP